jgi:cyclophilin family peptidyl-prolyl cis-trans isomerase
VGTAKRARQKANRQLKVQAQQQVVQRRRTKRRAIRIGIIAVAFVAGAFLLSRVWGNDGSTVDTAATTVPTSLPDGATSSAPPTSAFPLYGTTPCPPTDGSATQQRTFSSQFQQCIDPTKTYTARFATSQGEFTVTLDAKKAPATVNNFVSLARSKYFDGTICHRVVKDFVIQCGDPEGTGRGGPGYEIADELPQAGEYKLGSLAMANTGQPNTGGSQFFIITGPNGEALPPQYSLFGSVTEGYDTTVAKMAALAGPGDGPPTATITIESVTITES